MFRSILVLLLLALLPAAARAADANLDFGGDSYAAGDHPSITTAVSHDAFMAGNTVSLSAPVTGSAHLAGITVNADAPVTGNLYAAGISVAVSAPVGGSLSAAGNSVDIKQAATIAGNARLAGATVSLAAPVTGSALVSARSLALTNTVTGDLDFRGSELTFGPEARVGGTLSIHAPKPITVPASVASADRVKFEQVDNPDLATRTGNGATNLLGGFGTLAVSNLLWWLFLFIVGAALIVLAPRAYDIAQRVAAHHFWRNLGIGILGFAAALGLLPAAAFTVVGIVLIPFILLLIIVLCVLGYIAGIFFAALRIVSGLTAIDNNGKRVGVLALGLVIAGLLALIPFLGWLISLLLMLYGIGIVITGLFERGGGGTVLTADGPPPPLQGGQQPVAP